MERKNELKSLYNQARLAGLCSTQKEFARILNMNEISMSMAMNGDERYLTDNLFSKIERLFAEHNIQTVNENNGTVINQQKNFNTSDATQTPSIEMYKALIEEMRATRIEKDRQIDRLLTIIENMQK